MTLIEQLEQAKHGSRELDAMIQILVFEKPDYQFPKQVLNRTPSSWQEACERFRHDGFGGAVPWPAYTTSIDAALTLVPDGWCRIEFGRYEDEPDRFWANIQGVDKHTWSENCITPALAICIAALRARGEG